MKYGMRGQTRETICMSERVGGKVGGKVGIGKIESMETTVCKYGKIKWENINKIGSMEIWK